MSLFTERVQKLMARDKITQKELSALSGISESSISRYLSGSIEPRMDVVMNVAKAFNVSPSYLLEADQVVQTPNAFNETIAVVTRNKSKLSDEEKAKIIKVLFGG